MKIEKIQIERIQETEYGKEKLARLAKANGYEKSTAAFLNDLIAGIKE